MPHAPRATRGGGRAQVLCIQGFLACRSQADRIMLLVEMMANSGCPCFKAGARAVRRPASPGLHRPGPRSLTTVVEEPLSAVAPPPARPAAPCAARERRRTPWAAPSRSTP